MGDLAKFKNATGSFFLFVDDVGNGPWRDKTDKYVTRRKGQYTADEIKRISLVLIAKVYIAQRDTPVLSFLRNAKIGFRELTQGRAIDKFKFEFDWSKFEINPKNFKKDNMYYEPVLVIDQEFVEFSNTTDREDMDTTDYQLLYEILNGLMPPKEEAVPQQINFLTMFNRNDLLAKNGLFFVLCHYDFTTSPYYDETDIMVQLDEKYYFGNPYIMGPTAYAKKNWENLKTDSGYNGEITEEKQSKEPETESRKDDNSAEDQPETEETLEAEPETELPKESNPEKDSPKDDETVEAEPGTEVPQDDGPMEEEPVEDEPEIELPQEEETIEEEPKEEEPKEDEPKEDEPKEDEPKEEEPAEEEPKEWEPKEDEPKEDEPKEDEPKEDEPKEDEPKEEELKEEDPV